MKHYLYPDATAKSSYDIPYEELYKLGYRGVIYDIDNTLVPHGAPADDRAIALFKRLKSIGFDTVLISNNKEPRVRTFADAVGSRYIYKANKPMKKGYLSAMKLMNTNDTNTFFVGDQLFTDVWGAKRVGIKSYLVDQIDKKEEIQIVIKRRIEWIVLFFYKRYIKKNGCKWPDIGRN
ncbi:MAG: YqeG family HAD IIIA-type phosphatase [Butyrivibrio sp.]|uniref:YqeG family HAD IIIA-type phosphatase n=1 Tax=Butyrivibrio sp. TaxID=28121 RepID=UPI0025DE2478|nr:YqeG family HAD IIIA-type phosphatase [Butyrivibrio sp.]MCR5769994.1 YqeG family HAD IIIA-type phosphatase [Butyrivibrio sp.]